MNISLNFFCIDQDFMQSMQKGWDTSLLETGCWSGLCGCREDKRDEGGGGSAESSMKDEGSTSAGGGGGGKSSVWE